MVNFFKMWTACVLVLVSIITNCLLFCQGEEQRGIVHVYGSSRIKVKLDCGSKFMNVNLFLNGTAPFFDWIVVGKTNRPECRQQGNGDLQYLIEVPLLNDPCGTRMIDPSGTFENVISIKRMPLLILEGDETISVQCVYGPPEIGTQIIPTLPPSQNVQQSFLTTPRKDQIQDESANIVETTKVAGILPAHVYLIIFMVLFLTLLCLCCGCMYFFFKRRKLRVERRKKLLLAVPANSEMSKLGLRHLWWSGKHGLGGHGGGGVGGANGSGGNVSNDALLSHDYMVSTNSTTRGHLSVSTDYPGSTPPSSGGSSNTSAGTATGLVIRHPDSPDDSSGDGGNGTTQYVHDARRMTARGHTEPMVPGANRTAAGVMVASSVVANSLRCIPEERGDHLRSDDSTATSTTRSTKMSVKSSTQNASSRRPVYASVEKKNKSYQNGDSPNPTPIGGQSPDSATPQGDTLISHVRSISEIYSIPSREGETSDRDNDADAVSISTLEGKQYSPTQEQIRQATIVRADIHHMTNAMVPPPPPPPPPLVASPPLSSPPPPPAISIGHFEEGDRRSKINSAPDIDWEIFIRAIESDRSPVLNDRDTDRWRRLLLGDDGELRQRIAEAKTLEDFESISRSPKYAREFSREKWAHIVNNLSQAAFMRRLSNIIDHQKEQQKSIQSPAPISIGPKSDHRSIDPPKSLNASELLRHHQSDYDAGDVLRNLQSGRQKRLFTRESYYQVKRDIEPVAISNQKIDLDSEDPIDSRQQSTTTTMFRDRSNSEIFETPPMLTVYLGDVQTSSIAERNNNLYSESFLSNNENSYSTASNIGAMSSSSLANVRKSYHYESNGIKNTDDDEEQKYEVANSSNNGIGSVYAAPSSSTIYAPESAVAQWKHF